MAAAADWPADAVEVGRIAGAWGVKGWFKVTPYADEPLALLGSRYWHLQPAETILPSSTRVAGALPATPLPPRLDITAQRMHGDFVVATARDIADRSAAESLRGARIFISRASFPKTGDDEFYWADLIGLDVFNREGVALGRVDGLLDTGPHGVLRVQGEAADEERLIPFVAAYVDTVDLAGRRIVVDWALDF